MNRLPFMVTGAKRHLDMAWVKHALKTSYWGAQMTDEAIQTAVNNSLTFGAYLRETREQIGFCRVLTDRALNSTITDIIVAENWRRQGVGSLLMREVFCNPWVAPTHCFLRSRDAKRFYEQHGFVEVGGDVMLRSPTR